MTRPVQYRIRYVVPMVMTALLMGGLSIGVFAQDRSGVVDTPDLQLAESLYENHCQECHDQRAFTREQRLAGNIEQLQSWVTAWSVHAGLGWGTEDIRAVTAYINQRFYGYHD